MASQQDPGLRRRQLILLYVLFTIVLVVEFVVWVASGLCENDCVGPASLAHELAYLIIGPVFAAAGVGVQIRLRPVLGTLLWMVGAVLLFHGVLITISSGR